ncbi:MAG: response regulator transcription factor [bacterium]
MISVTIIEDDQVLRDSLAVLIRGTRGFSCTGTYDNWETALQNLDEDLPDVTLLDIELKGRSGIEGVAKIKEKQSDVAIVMLTIHEDNESVFHSLRNGASGYLVKNVEPADLLDAIKEVHAGGSPMSMAIARMVTNSFRKEQILNEVEI